MQKGNRTDLPELNTVTWRKSSRSADQGNCVELAGLSGRVAVRDSKNPDQAAILVPRNRWSTFARTIRKGELALALES